MPEEVEKDESVIERVEDIVAEIHSREDLDGGDMVDNFRIEIGEYGGFDGLQLLKAYADRFLEAHKAEMKEVIDLLQKALDVCWKAECYFRWLNEQKKEGKANA